jgi:hypothetical protein
VLAAAIEQGAVEREAVERFFIQRIPKLERLPAVKPEEIEDLVRRLNGSKAAA